MNKINKYNKIKNFSLITYFCLVVIRIVLVFIPQYGYIHPDEFFQTAEIVSGENLSIDIGEHSIEQVFYSVDRRNISTGSNKNVGVQQLDAD